MSLSPKRVNPDALLLDVVSGRPYAAGQPVVARVRRSSMPIRDVDGFAPTAQGPVRVFANRGVDGIDGLLSTSIGVALADGRPTVLRLGDVAMLHDVGAWSAAHFEMLFGTPHGLSFEAAADLGGASYHRCESATAVGPRLEQALMQGGRHLLEVHTSRHDAFERRAERFRTLAGAVA